MATTAKDNGGITATTTTNDAAAAVSSRQPAYGAAARGGGRGELSVQFVRAKAKESSCTSFFVAFATVALAAVVAVRTLGGGMNWFVVTASDDCVTMGGKSGLPSIVGTPVFVVGMPKAGTSTIAAYFECGSVKTSHYICGGEEKCGQCISRNMKLKLPPLSACGQYEVYAQLDYVGEINEEPSPGSHPEHECYFPQVEALNAIHAEFPSATFILNLRRSVPEWIGSINHWVDLRKRLANCQIPGLPRGKGAAGPVGDDELTKFIAHHNQQVREFVRLHPTHKLVEVVIDNPGAGQHMQEVFNIPASCWGHANDNPTSGGRGSGSGSGAETGAETGAAAAIGAGAGTKPTHKKAPPPSPPPPLSDEVAAAAKALEEAEMAEMEASDTSATHEATRGAGAGGGTAGAGTLGSDAADDADAPPPEPPKKLCAGETPEVIVIRGY